mgnify:CR=1 FL=1
MRERAPSSGPKVSASVCPVAHVPFSFCGSLETTVRVLSRLGYNGFELLLRRSDDANPRILESLVSRYEMTLAAIGTGLAAMEGLSLSSPSESIRQKAVARVLNFSKLAEAFDCPVIVGSIKGQPGKASSQRALGKSLQQLKGLRAVLEPMNRYESPFLNTAAEAASFIRKNELRDVGILLDSFHMNIEEPSMPGAIAMAGNLLKHVHIADSNRNAPGKGHIPFLQLLRALNRVRYDQYLSAEILQAPCSEVVLAETIRFLRSMVHKTYL